MCDELTNQGSISSTVLKEKVDSLLKNIHQYEDTDIATQKKRLKIYEQRLESCYEAETFKREKKKAEEFIVQKLVEMKEKEEVLGTFEHKTAMAIARLKAPDETVQTSGRGKGDRIVPEDEDERNKPKKSVIKKSK